MSKGEQKIQAILFKNHIPFETEKTFPDLKGKKNHLLRFDFAIYSRGRIQCLLEFDGQQHFARSNHFQKTTSKYLGSLENDRKKNRYCLGKGIPLFRIPYWDIEQIEKLEDLFRPQYRVKSIYHNDELRFNRREF